ncbi:MAG: hypothetical protein WBC13_00885 [Dokdonella sp.]
MYKTLTEFEVRRMCSADKTTNAALTQQHEQTMDDVGDALMEMQNSAFALGYLRAQDEAAQKIADMQAKLASVPAQALWRHWRSSKLTDEHPYSTEEIDADFEAIFDWFASGILGNNHYREEALRQAEAIAKELNAHFPAGGWVAAIAESIWWYGYAWHEAAGITVRRSQSPKPQYYAHFPDNPREVGRGDTPVKAYYSLLDHWRPLLAELSAEVERLEIVRRVNVD